MATEKATTTKRASVRKLTDNSIVTVISNFDGLLYYRSPRTQDEFEWGEYGDEVDMPISELKTMKAQHKTFFAENFIIFPIKDQDVIKHLKLEKYYGEIILPEDIDNLFDVSVDEFARKLDNSPNNVKAVILARARAKYKNGELSNYHIIRTIEDKLSVNIDINNPK